MYLRPTGSLIAYAPARRLTLSVRNCPHAARISRPRGERTGEENPASMTILREAIDRAVAAGLERAAGPGVERDQVHLGGNAGDQPHQFARIGLAVVHALQHDVFERDAAGVRGAGVTAAGRDQLGDRILAVQRHQFVAQLIAHGMQRHCEVDAEFRARAVHHRHDARGGQRDAPA